MIKVIRVCFEIHELMTTIMVGIQNSVLVLDSSDDFKIGRFQKVVIYKVKSQNLQGISHHA